MVMHKQQIESKRDVWGRHYEEAMQSLLGVGTSADALPAEKLGHEASALGLTPLDVAWVHEKTLNKTLCPENAMTAGRKRLDRADAFFKETIAPIEATHRAARKAEARISRLAHTLEEREAESSVTDDQLEEATIRRESVEANADQRSVDHKKLLVEAESIQKKLRDRMEGIMSQQEGERKRLSGALRNQIAQALVSIDLSLQLLNRSGKLSTDKLEKSIVDARRILKELQ